MLNYFPYRFDDELLYSIVSRYAYNTGIKSPIHIMNELFDKNNSVLSIDLPNRIARLTDKLPCVVKVSNENIVYENTLFALFFPFLDTDRQKKIYNQMLGDNGNAIHLSSGSMASNIHILKHLRYCPLCVKEDIDQYGIPYWHRSHNVDGVVVCHKHGVFLCEKTDESNAYIYNNDRLEFVSLQAILDSGGKLEGMNPVCSIVISKNERKLLQDIARCVYYIMNHKFYLTGCNSDKIHDIYYLKMQENGLYYNDKRIKQKQVKEQLVEYYGNDLLKMLGLEFSKNIDYLWTKDLLNKKQRVCHPIKHILLINWLYKGDMDKFAEDIEKNIQRIEDTFWPCLNPVADHYNKSVIQGYNIRYNYKKKYYFAIFNCSCGFVYTRRLDNIDDLYSYDRVLKYGDQWEQELKRLILSGTNSQMKISKILRVHNSTVRAYGRRLGILPLKDDRVAEKKDKKNNVKNDRVDAKKAKTICKELISALDKKPMTKFELEHKYHKQVAWLRWKYNELLLMIETHCCTKHTNRVDWNKRDIIIYSLVREEIEKIKSNLHHRRITISMVGKNIGYLSILQKHLDKLPKTKKYLEKNVEAKK